MENLSIHKMIFIGWLSFILAACNINFPKDPNNTLNEILTSRRLVAGICPNIPFGEKTFLSDLATSLNAEITYKINQQEKLYRSLENHEVDIVACSIDKNTPWKSRLSLSLPFPVKTSSQEIVPFVFAVKQGENRWLIYVNEFIHDKEDTHATHH